MEITFRKTFTPVTLKINSEVELANLLGALVGYGTANVYAENNLKAIGLGEFYSGNVRKAARLIAAHIAGTVGLDLPGVEAVIAAYVGSAKFNASKASKAGAAALGTTEDLAPGYAPTNFEAGGTAEDEDEQEDLANDLDNGGNF
jgi:hypothetical protein